MPKRTYQPSNRRKSRRQGFLARAKKSAHVISRRRKRGRVRLTPVN